MKRGVLRLNEVLLTHESISHDVQLKERERENEKTVLRMKDKD